MVQLLLIGIAAGAASALLFASVVSGSLLSILLFYLAPLPILLAAIGWSHLAGLAAAAVAAGALGAALGWFFFVTFLIGVGLPAWLLGYLALMARPSPDGTTLEWYPPGRLVVWAAVLGALVVVAALPHFGLSADAVHSGLKQALEQMLKMQTETPADAPVVIPGIPDTARLVDFLAIVIPPMAAVLTTLTSLVNLWLAGRIVLMSGRLRRPWPALAGMTFPRIVPLLLAASFAGAFLPGLTGIASGILAASLLIAYGILGFAVMHAVTAGLNGRGFILGGVYGAIAVFGWPILLMALIGLVESVLNLRRRITSRRAPPRS